jgi:GMP synthase (glutamine-hydrolysing)
MAMKPPQTETHRVRTSDDVEVSTYLEISREKAGEQSAGERTEAAPVSPEAIVVLDFGSQFSMLIARRIRECNVYCELVPWNAPKERIAHLNTKGFILSGGPASVYQDDAPVAPAWVYESGKPVLGICYGMQLMAHQLAVGLRPVTGANTAMRWSTRVRAAARCWTRCQVRFRSG